ncbi:Pimeloyl-ACP methyl ester carboxylesterase [Candidatus Methylobacter favarea]|uniref:Pimeloyl-ACP methyl ester carboxylesterase n=1 Tax=Candidatus Methylobacter favarea TaxID=2707345 RepID=A0A8S0XIE2_9GAMM|nr:alpha/beta hydrolase [Candidatus Methylobacter favarea]CAA9890636.1 Pimeloyl-ACP methyl ester carboxylesterase [Candidatus Methylobacter favarea]
MAEKDQAFLLLRGFLREQRHWGGFINQLQAEFPGRQIITLDIPGNGRLYKENSPCTIAEMTDHLRHQIHLKILVDGLTLIALSMGGMIAIDWMIRFPAEISKAVLINTSVRPFSPFYQRLRWQNYLLVIKALAMQRFEREKLILFLTSNLSTDNSRLLNDWAQWNKECPVSPANALRQLLATAKFSVPERPEQPVLIVSSRSDRLVHHQCSIDLAKAWSVPFIEHPSAGHDVPLDDPVWLSSHIGTWIRSLAME